MAEPVHIVRFPQLERAVEVPEGTNLLDAASQAGITFGQLCGGTGSCKRCKLKIIEGQVNGKNRSTLTPEEVSQGFVLACLCTVESPLTVEAPEQFFDGNGLETHIPTHPASKTQAVDPPNPLTQKIFLPLAAPDLANNQADQQRLLDGIVEQMCVETPAMDLATLKNLPRLLRENDWSVTATIATDRDGAKILRVEGGDACGSQTMVAADIGTTSIAAQLLDSRSGDILASSSLMNSQSVFGCDVTSRIMAAEKQGAAKLQQAVANDLNSAISAMCQTAGTKKDQVQAIVCSGNTVMCHLLLGLDAANIRRSPYIAVTTQPSAVAAKDVGIDISPKGMLYCVPGIGSWVGGDITAGIIETGLHTGNEISLLMDIGTNGEIVIGNRDWLMACSASAGPALEGAGVECGMRATAGAIERVEVRNGTLRLKTIGDKLPKGICGSGIIDLVSALLETGIIDRAGLFTETGKHKHILVPASRSGTGIEIAVTEADIENIINAKAALYAAMKLLLKRLALDFSSIHRFVIAGTFGNYIDIQRAISIGLLPDLPPETFEFAGNTSLAGARRAALHRETYLQLHGIARNTTYYDLMGAEDYVEEFRKALFLPHTDIAEFHMNGNNTQRKL